MIRSARSKLTSRCSVLAFPVLLTWAMIAERRRTLKTSAISNIIWLIGIELKVQL